MRAELAARRARDLAPEPWRPKAPEGRTHTRRVAVGDPQAPLSVFLEVLARHDLLGDDGWLVADVHLVSIGDHFDWGGAAQRRQAAEDGLAILAWLAAHPPDQVTLIAGNHDLGRVGELAGFDDDTFAEVHERAVLAYRGGDPDPLLQRELCETHPCLATAEVAARDFAAFSAAQRELVWSLLCARRLRLGFAAGEHLLFCHAGVTSDHLSAIGLPHDARASAPAVADGLNAALDSAVAAHAGGALVIDALHRPGDYRSGEGGGMLYHRPANPDVEQNRGHDLSSTLGRRFDPRRLPAGLTQVIGHISDAKCRELLGPWARDEEPRPGELRHLITDGRQVAYSAGLPAASPTAHEAMLVFIDGLMYRTPVDRYAVYEW